MMHASWEATYGVHAEQRCEHHVSIYVAPYGANDRVQTSVLAMDAEDAAVAVARIIAAGDAFDTISGMTVIGPQYSRIVVA